MEALYCACCGRPFKRASHRGPAPLYCSQDCRLQMAVRRRVWAGVTPAAWAATREKRGNVYATAAGF